MKLGMEFVPPVTDEGIERLRALGGTVAKVRAGEGLEKLEGFEIGTRPIEDGAPMQPYIKTNLLFSEIDNEPNHPDSELSIDTWAERFEPKWVDRWMTSPGLAVNFDEPAWIEEFDQYNWKYRGFHLYWDGDNDFEGYMARLDTVGRYPMIVTELGDSSDDPWEVKVPRYIEALKRCRDRGVEVAILFLADSPDPQWARFIPPTWACQKIAEGLEAA